MRNIVYTTVINDGYITIINDNGNRTRNGIQRAHARTHERTHARTNARTHTHTHTPTHTVIAVQARWVAPMRDGVNASIRLSQPVAGSFK